MQNKRIKRDEITPVRKIPILEFESINLCIVGLKQLEICYEVIAVASVSITLRSITNEKVVSYKRSNISAQLKCGRNMP